MENRRSRPGRRWMLLPIALFALALQSVGTIAAAEADRCPVFGPMKGLAGCAAFIPMWGLNVTPSGLAVDRFGNVYVSIRITVDNVLHGQIWKYTPAGEQSLYADLGNAEIYGLEVTAHGDLYACMARVGVDRGVYRVDREGQIELLLGSDQIVFPNALAFDYRGTLYVTESYSGGSGTPPVYEQGGIWRIPRGGQAELWLRDPLLTGKAIPGVLPYPIGANGIAFHHGYLYVTNTVPAQVVRIPVLPDGSAGKLELWAMLQDVPESPLKGSGFPLMADDVRLDVHGNVYVAVVSWGAVVRINAWDKSQETLAAFQIVQHGSVPYAPLDFSASVRFGTDKGERQSLWVTNLGNGAKNKIGGLPWPGPGLVKIDACGPGRAFR